MKQFEISPAQVQVWSLEVPPGMPLLFWCLLEAKVPAAEYLEWAKESFGMPLLNPAFFENSSNFDWTPNPNIEWQPWLVPLAQWEDLTYVGCIQPPTDTSSDIVYVLVPPVELNEFYKLRFPETPLLGEELPPPIEAPEGFDLDIPTGKWEMPEGLLAATPVSISENPPPMEELPPEPSPVEEILTVVAAAPESSSELQSLNFDQWWSEAKILFTNCVLLHGNSSGLKIVWSNGQGLNGEDVKLNQPSLFRIAMRTMKPYHGFVVDNEVHKEFFKAIGLTESPRSVTAIATKCGGTDILMAVYFGFMGESPEAELPSAVLLSQKFESDDDFKTVVKQSA